MRVLIIGGTGLISTGIVKHLLARGADVTAFNRAQTQPQFAGQVKQITGDRNDFEAFEARFAGETFDVVIDMICYMPGQAESAIRAFGGRCEQFIFCSTVCTYGTQVPPHVLIDETFPQQPLSDYGNSKLWCEQTFMQAHADGKFKTTIIRPSCTYGPGGRLIDNLEFEPVAWDRIEKNQPVLCAGDGLGLWVGTHRDDVGKLFAYAAMNPKTYGQAYNATGDDHVTWRQWYRRVANILERDAQLLFMPAGWIVNHDSTRFTLLAEITQFHGAYSSEKAKRDVPEFKPEIAFDDGAKATLDDLRQRGAWRSSNGDELYQSMVDKAIAAGVGPVPA
jgi:nucleoside-diphosphate-sugar epimerase